jgi:hypothetical protein
MSSNREKVSDLIEIILAAVAQEAGTTQDKLSVEVESTVTRGCMESFQRGIDHVHTKPTDPPPPPRRTTPQNFPAPLRNPGSSQRLKSPIKREDD